MTPFDSATEHWNKQKNNIKTKTFNNKVEDEVENCIWSVLAYDSKAKIT